MDKEYLKIVSEVECKKSKFKNAIISFLSGGLIGLISEVIYISLKNMLYLDNVTSYTVVFIFWVTLASILTGFGIFDKLTSIFKCGFIIPSTGFSHSMTSAAMDNNKEGFVTGIGSNIFRLTGSIILYGIVFAIICAFIKGVFM